MNSTRLRYQWAADLPRPAKAYIQSAIQIDNQRYAVAPCHPGHMTAVVQSVQGTGGQYIYELRCTCEAVIRTDGGMLPVTGVEGAT